MLYRCVVRAGGVRLLALQTFGRKNACRSRRGLISRAAYLAAAGLSARTTSSFTGEAARVWRDWLREADSNGPGLSTRGYEPRALPTTLYPAFVLVHLPGIEPGSPALQAGAGA